MFSVMSMTFTRKLSKSEVPEKRIAAEPKESNTLLIASRARKQAETITN